MTAVKPERILKELADLWVDLGKQEQNGVLRACAMTLIVVVDEAQDAQAIGGTIAGIMHEHPSRAIVLRVHAGEGPLLESRVFAQCWMPFGQRQQICCEQIEITASEESLCDVPGVLRGIIVPDLPVVIYCPSEQLWWSPGFQQLLPLATRLVLDSAAMPNALRVIPYLNGLPSIARSDLVWTRLTPWREAIARVFDEPSRLRAVYDIEEVRMLYAGPEEPTSVYYLAGWFMQVLGAGVRLKIAPGVGPHYCSIAHVQIISPRFNADLELVSGQSLELRIGGERQQLTVLPPLSDEDALRQELSIAERDVAFEDVLGLAQLMRGGK